MKKIINQHKRMAMGLSIPDDKKVKSKPKKKKALMKKKGY